MPGKPAGRRFPIVPELSQPTSCFSFSNSSGQRMAAIVEDHRSSYALIMEHSNIHIPLHQEKQEAVTAVALSRQDASFVALATRHGRLLVYSIDSGATNVDLWMDASIANNEQIVHCEFVPPLETAFFASSLVALTSDGNLIAIDVFGSDGSTNASSSNRMLNETTGLLSANKQHEQHGSFRIQSSVKLSDYVMAQSEQPTGALVVLDDNPEQPLVVVGMSGGTLLVLKRELDEDGYTWSSVKQLSLPSAILSLALSTHGANSESKFPILAAGLEDGEVALLDATAPTTDISINESHPPFSPFHFLRAHHDDGVPVSRLCFYWSRASDGGFNQLHLAIASGSLLRICNMATFEIFYAYNAGVRIRDVTFCPDGKERVLVARDDNVTESVTWSPWRIILGESTFQKMHSQFRPSKASDTAEARGSKASIANSQLHFGNLFHQHPVTSLSFSGDSNSLAVPAGSDVILCDSSDWLPVEDVATKRTRVERLTTDPNDTIRQTVYSPDSTMLAITTALTSNGPGYRLLLYTCSAAGGDPSDWELRETISLSTQANPSISFSPTSEYLVVTETVKFTVFSLRGATMREASKILQPSAEASCASFSPDGTILATSHGSMVVFYRVGSFDKESQLALEGNDDMITSLSFGSDSTTLAVAMSSGLIFILSKEPTLDWDIRKSLKCNGTSPTLLFSPDISSPFLVTVDGTSTCTVFSTESWEVVQELSCSRGSKWTSVAFDPSGTILAIGGETKSHHLETPGGSVMIVRVGELLRLKYFSIGESFANPPLLCQKLSALSDVERAQILFYRSDVEESEGHAHFPLERKIRGGIATEEEDDNMASLGSTAMARQPPFEALMKCLTYLLMQFPQTAFVGCAGHGNMFETILERDNPRLLKLLFDVTLVSCQSCSYMIMNEEMRNGTVTNALVASADAFPEVVCDVVRSLVLWPATIYSPNNREWRLTKGEPIYRTGSETDLYTVTEDASDAVKGGLMARPMVLPMPNLGTLAFLTALTEECDLEVFSKHELGIMLDDLWEKEIKGLFFFDLLFYVVFCICWSLLVTKTAKTPEQEPLDSFTLSLVFVVFTINLFLIFKGLLQLRSSSDWYKPKRYYSGVPDQPEQADQYVVNFVKNMWLNPTVGLWYGFLWLLSDDKNSLWVICDIVTYWMVIITLVLTLWKTSTWTVAFAVVTTFLVFLKLLGYLRGFEICGWLLTVLHRNCVDSRGFLTVIFIMLVCFAVMFQLLVGPFNAEYDTSSSSFFSIFEMGILGFVDRTQFEQTTSVFLTSTLLIILILVVYIVALNGYIALLGGSYAQVAEVQDASKRYQKATLIVGYLKLISHKWRDRITAERRYIFALVPIVDDNDWKEGSEKHKYSS